MRQPEDTTMSTMIHIGSVPARRSRPMLGPPILFGATLAVAGAAFAAGSRTLPEPLLVSVAATLLFVLAAGTALFASLRRDAARRPGFTYWDVAGALTLAGIFAAATIEPEQLVSALEAARRDP
jgi:hypothetical protein